MRATGNKTAFRTAIVLCVVSTLSGACKHIPEPYVPGVRPVGDDGKVMYKSGKEYCSALAEGARDTNRDLGIWGWTLATGAAGTLTAESVVVATSGKEQDGVEKAFIIALPAASALFTIGALGLFKRQEHTSTLAAAANRGAYETDDAKATRDCNEALAVWNESLPQTSAGITNELQQKEKELEKAKAEKAAELKAATLICENNVWSFKEAGTYKLKLVTKLPADVTNAGFCTLPATNNQCVALEDWAKDAEKQLAVGDGSRRLAPFFNADGKKNPAPVDCAAAQAKHTSEMQFVGNGVSFSFVATKL